jgi:hypothetical protein
MKHYQVNFVDGTVETVEADSFPHVVEYEFMSPINSWWHVTLMHLDAETQTKFVPYGKIHINHDNVTFIKET